MKLGTVGGIGVYIHWTFWLLIGAYLFSSATSYGIVAGLIAAGFILSIFACVLLHEFGHSAAAAMYGIPTADITLLPIGGVARLKRLPEKPVQELVIALAGPAVNVVIAGVLLIPLVLGATFAGGAPALGLEMGFLEQLIAANIFLVIFNLIPAFPMDGGRVLRSLLAMRTNHLRATEIAARVGRWLALVFAVVAVIQGPITLLLIAGFIFVAGTAELFGARMAEARKGQADQPAGPWTVQMWPSSGPDAGPFAGAQGGFQRQAWTTENPYANPDVIDAIEVREVRESS